MKDESQYSGGDLGSCACCWCEYFDGGGEKRVAAARAGERISGDCGSSRGARFEPMSDEVHTSCFVPDSTDQTPEKEDRFQAEMATDANKEIQDMIQTWIER